MEPKPKSFTCRARESPIPNNKKVINDINASRIETTDRKAHKRKLSDDPQKCRTYQSFPDSLYNEVLDDPQFRDHSRLLKTYTIEWIKENAQQNQLPQRKAPFLIATIHNLEILVGKYPIINVKLKDVTGEINATIAHKLYEEYTDNLVNGSCIVIKEFGVLKTGMQQSYCIAVSSHNLVAIYSRKDSKVHKIHVQNWDCNRLVSPAAYGTAWNGKQLPRTKTDPPYLPKTSVQLNNRSSKNLLLPKTSTEKNVVVNKGKCDLFSSVTDELDLILNDNLVETPINVIKSKEDAVNTPEQQDIWKSVLEDIDINELLDEFWTLKLYINYFIRNETVSPFHLFFISNKLSNINK